MIQAASEPDSLARAKELMDLIVSPTTLVTGVLLVFSRNQLAKNDQATVDRPMTYWALVAALAGCGIALIIVVVMTPLAFRVVFINRGGIQTRLLVYVLTYLVAIGVVMYAGFVVMKARGHLWPSSAGQH